MKMPKAKGAKQAYSKHEKSESPKQEKVERAESQDIQAALRGHNAMHQKALTGNSKKGK